MVDEFGTPKAFERQRRARICSATSSATSSCKWGSKALDNFKVVPPGTGICHQVNLEYIAQAVWIVDGRRRRRRSPIPTRCVGTDSHTTMVNGLGVLGWGVGGIEAEAAMLGQPVSMLIPEVVGFKLTGALAEGITATDLVLTVTQMLRAKGVVGRFVEFYGPGLDALTLADRATIANMAPEYGATCGFFPIDDKTIDYLRLTGRDDDEIALVEAYAKAQGLWRDADAPDPVFTDTLELDMATVAAVARRPEAPAGQASRSTRSTRCSTATCSRSTRRSGRSASPVDGRDHDIGDGDVVIAAITSCTNTSNPSVLVAAGLVARKARALGPEAQALGQDQRSRRDRRSSPTISTRPGCSEDLDAIGFNLVGYGCTTCIGNSGPLRRADQQGDQRATTSSPPRCCRATATSRAASRPTCAPTSSPRRRWSSPMRSRARSREDMIDHADRPGHGRQGRVSSRTSGRPTTRSRDVMAANIDRGMFRARYADVYEGDAKWQAIDVDGLGHLQLARRLDLCRQPALFRGHDDDPGAGRRTSSRRKPLAILGDSITTDHISPGRHRSRPTARPARYLKEHQVSRRPTSTATARAAATTK